ncbi:unnamed protein product (macronuclear) [Paramecium tetraurelia]|uniref:Peptide deformylase n=1 Tax=Paramecium tetraurelia TaxID=5888 RepID=A0DLN6_PARTE|nr:uncharacterized protein GSPATT00039585001 [Paramecium tetraurelia]CAK83953.1 unnamed protein product [Paramecium tetraurelia]|eukprot:XP_001451350.1 hypothetical protein (macronuclear) [Paramecium tetraurelia strain d4-2]
MKFADKLIQQQNPPAQVHRILRIGDKDYQKITQQTQPIQMMSQRMKQIIQCLKMTAAQENAVSLSCPQIGYNYQIFVVLKHMKKNQWCYNNLSSSDYMTLINPQKLKQSRFTQVEWEECPSFPFLMGKVERPYKIEYQFINEKFKLIKQTLSGFEARVVQHEMDHLEGITLDSPDKMLLESKRESFKCDDINFEGLQEQLADLELASMKMKLDQFKGNK